MAAEPQCYETFSGTLAAFVGERGAEGVYTRREGLWLFHPPDSLRWDALHQQVFRNSRGVPLTAEDLAARDIPAPPTEAPAGSRPAVWGEQFEAEMSADEAPPGFLPRLYAAGGSAVLWLVLFEDLYETASGDGRFLYAAAAFWDEAGAAAWAAAAPAVKGGDGAEAGYRLTLKPVPVALANGRVKAELGVGPYEHYTVRDLLRRLAKPVSFGSRLSRGL